ncbi:MULTISPECIES: HNH endonuclease [Larsenimonas]|uniref:HNH endonuclease n=1 Tax=Larsenimonas suaedae TaxID=1851019 RepID=A0ABU1GTK6_9GAMM|nr:MULTISPECIES: HNH endonuclease [Larsenimonas]MCM2971813.1 HNH endonuclease [Larsenimonas suaedae]MCM5703891.1 HNH endonuclease [Larsenimonas salina]MDR5895365.1 HNH endonuclease [Larsenimonas suaedae]
MRRPMILRLHASGIPIDWLTLEEATMLMTRREEGAVVWTDGDARYRLHGGTNSLTGRRSFVDIPEVIGVSPPSGAFLAFEHTGFNRVLCKHREGLRCAYCGCELSRQALTIDHVLPRSRGGELSMLNAVAACRDCNALKSNRTPEEAGMALLLKPFVPTMAEVLYMMRPRTISPLQLWYLKHQFKNAGLRDYLTDALAA